MNWKDNFFFTKLKKFITLNANNKENIEGLMSWAAYLSKYFKRKI